MYPSTGYEHKFLQYKHYARMLPKASYSLSTNDIDGAQPKRRIEKVRSEQNLRGIGAQIMMKNDNSKMIQTNALDKIPDLKNSKGVFDVMNMGEKYVPKNLMNSLSTQDINGKEKKNAYGQVLKVEDRFKNIIAG